MLHINSRKPCYFAEVPGVPQTYTLIVLWIQIEGAQIYIWVKPKLHIHIEHGPSFILCSTHPTQWTDSHTRWRCLLRLLCPVRRPGTTLYCVLLKDRNLALVPGQGPESNSEACLWVLPRPCHHIQCWLTNQRLILLLINCLETPKVGSGPTNFRAELPLVSSLVISFPWTQACPGTQ